MHGQVHLQPSWIKLIFRTTGLKFRQSGARPLRSSLFVLKNFINLTRKAAEKAKFLGYFSNSYISERLYYSVPSKHFLFLHKTYVFTALRTFASRTRPFGRSNSYNFRFFYDANHFFQSFFFCFLNENGFASTIFSLRKGDAPLQKKYKASDEK